MKIEHVKGKNKGKILLYALSTCIWCKKTRKLLEKAGLEYSYIYVDLQKENDQVKARKEMERLTNRCSFPTLVINDKDSIVGFKEDKIKEVLNI
jgi:glutaredoxin